MSFKLNYNRITFLLFALLLPLGIASGGINQQLKIVDLSGTGSYAAVKNIINETGNTADSLTILKWNPVTAGEKIKGGRDKSIWIRYHLPEISVPHPTLFIPKTPYPFHIYLGDEKIYSVELSHPELVSLDFLQWHLIPIPADSIQEPVYFRIDTDNIPPLTLHFGDASDIIINEIILSSIRLFIIGAVLFFIGIFSLSIFLKRRQIPFLSFCLLSIVSGINFITFSSIKQFLINDPYFWAMVNCLTSDLSTLFVFMLLFNIFGSGYRSAIKIMLWINALFIPFDVAILSMGMIDFSFIPFLSLMVINLLVAVPHLVYFIINGNNEAKAFAIGVSAFGFTGIFVAFDLFGLAMPFMFDWGVLIFAITIGYILLSRYEEIHRQAQKSKRIEHEIAIAKRIQQSILQEGIPQYHDLLISARYIPTESVAGDFYNIQTIDENKIAIMIADVSGHGIPSALISAMLKISVRMLRDIAMKPSIFLHELNKNLYGNIEDQYLTASYIVLDTHTKTLFLARAGHLPLILCKRETKEIMEYMPKGMGIGFSPEVDYEELAIPLSSGDRILLITDGIVEAMNNRDEMFGEYVFKELIVNGMDKSGDDFISMVHEHLTDWIGKKAKLDDDFTILIIDIL